MPEPTEPMDNPFMPRRSHRVWIAAFLGLIALADLLMWPLVFAFNDPPNAVLPLVMSSLLGVTLAQFGVLATWLVFSELTLAERLTRHWALALALFGVWAGGWAWTWIGVRAPVGELLEVLLVFGLALAPISLSVQLPLWLCRSLLGWRLLPFPSSATEKPGARLSIRDLMLTTAVVAVSLACVRIDSTRPNVADAQPWQMWGLGAPAICVAAAVSLLPLIAIILRPKSDRVAANGTLLVFAAWLAVIDLPIVVVAVRNGASGNPGLALIVVTASLFLLSFLGTLAAPLWLVRRDGYRLCFPGDARRSAAQRGLAGRAAPS